MPQSKPESLRSDVSIITRVVLKQYRWFDVLWNMQLPSPTPFHSSIPKYCETRKCQVLPRLEHPVQELTFPPATP